MSDKRLQVQDKKRQITSHKNSPPVITVNPVLVKQKKVISEAGSNALIVLIILLVLTSLSFMGPELSLVGSVVISAIPGTIVCLVVYKAFQHKGMAAVSGILAVAIMAWTGILNSFIENTYWFLLAISSISGGIASLILAGILGVVIREVMKK